MLHVEKRKMGFIQKSKNCLFFLIITSLAFFLRYIVRDFISYDMRKFLIPWYHSILNKGGLSALSDQVGDYGLLYQTIIALFTYTDVNPVYLYKSLSICFDFFLALSISYFITNNNFMSVIKINTVDGYIYNLSYAYVLLLPTVVMNSALWGQCDSIYSTFLLWSIWFLFKERFNLSFFMLGCAFAFKLQSILIVPLFIFYYLCKKKYSLLNFLIAFFSFWLWGIIAYIYGRGLFDSFRIYFFQVGEYKRMWMNIPSFWILGGEDYYNYYLFIFAIFLTFVILGVGLHILLSGRKQLNSYEDIIGTAVFVEWVCMLFLPAMHERYTYVLDIMLLILAFLDRKYITYAFISISISTLTYNHILFSGKAINSWYMLIYLFSWLRYSYVFFKFNTVH